METCQGIFFYVSKTFITWQESLQKKPTRKMKMMHNMFECGFENKEKVFVYQEFSVQVEGNLHGGNMPFTLGI